MGSSFALLYNFPTGTMLLLQHKEELQSNREDFGECGSGSDERETIELQLSSERNDSVPHYICEVENDQQTTAEKRAMKTSVVELAIFLRRSEAT